MKHDKPIYVTRPTLPPLDAYINSLQSIWESGIITNNGPFLQKFERALADYLGVANIAVFTNGTIALMTALRALRITGEVITTPFSFAATAHALQWSDITPVFVDIEPEFLNLDPKKIEPAISNKTAAILPVHIYGNPCDVNIMESIARKHDIRLIYDAAHAFGVSIQGTSIMDFGDCSVLSFHATKVFNTVEGGAIICRDTSLHKRIQRLRNFGFDNESNIIETGINGKMDELRASYGLLQLQYIDDHIANRSSLVQAYRSRLSNIPGLRTINDIENVRHTYPYFPIVIDPDEFGATRDAVYESLQSRHIHCRRNFFPLLSNLPMYRDLPSARPDNVPIAEIVSHRILCLPLYSGMEFKQVENIASIIQEVSCH